MSKTLKKEVGRTEHQRYGVLLIPMFPCEYYGGPIDLEGREWINSINDTNYFFRTEEEASKHALSMLQAAQVQDEKMKKRKIR